MSATSAWWKDFNWPTGLFIIGYHVGLLVGLPLYFANYTPSLAVVVTAFALLFLTEIGIGAAYHRYYAHRCYTLSRPAEAVLLFLATLATQGSALQWAYEHRLHHSFSDGDRDPYSVKKGFWHAHILWLFHRSDDIDERWVRDLRANPLVRFQHRFAGTLSVGSNLGVCLLAGWALGDYLGAFVLVWWTRLAISHHLTWFVNSLAHYWGERTYSREHTAVDNYILAVLTVGEGYHNFHHTFPSDYRNGVRWYHFDPTKWTIWSLSKIGMARNLKRISDLRIRKRLLMEDHKLLVHRLTLQVSRRRADLEQRIEQLSETMQAKLQDLSALRDQLRRFEVERPDRAAALAVRREFKALRQSFEHDWKAWQRLCGTVLAAT